MIRTLQKLGVAESKLNILPHSVDTDRFISLPETHDGSHASLPPCYDLLAVGQLIQRKRMDTLIEAVALCKAQGVVLSLAILGKGPLEAKLKQQAQNLGVTDSVSFLGYRDDVEDVVARARIFCLASEWEGVPFALMEAMSAGVVPVVTPVGTISDWVRDGENGVLTPVGDAPALASRLLSLRADGEQYNRLRLQLLEERQRLSFSAGTQVWRQIMGLTSDSPQL